MTQRRITPSFAEQDVFTGWRRVYGYLRRPGVCRRVKRRANRRDRRQARADIRRASAEG